MNWYNFFLKVLISGILLFTISSEVVLPKNFLSDQVIQQDSLPIIKSDFMVNTLAGPASAEQNYPAIASDSSGNYLTAWMDYRNGQADLYAQMFDKHNQRVGNNFKVNDEKILHYKPVSAIANAKGDFAVIWMDYYYYKVFAQRIDKNGLKIGSPIDLQLQGYSNLQFSAAMNSDGSFLVSFWTGISQSHLWTRIVDKMNNISYSLTAINDLLFYPSYSNSTRNISVNKDGNYTVVWSSNAGTPFSKIYAQVLDKNGNKIGGNFLVSSDTLTKNLYSAGIASTESGYRLFYWTSYFEVFYRLLKPDNSFVGAQQKINSNSWDYITANSNGKNKFAIFWNDGNSNLRLIDTSGNIILDSVVVDYGATVNKGAVNHQLSGIVDNQFQLIFRWGSGFDSDCAMRKFDLNFNPVSPFTITNDDSLGSNQTLPVVKFNNRGNLLFVWDDKRSGRSQVFGAVYDSSFNRINPDMNLTDYSVGYDMITEKVISSFSDGTFIVVYDCEKGTSSLRLLTLQLIDASGIKIGGNLILDSVYSYTPYQIAMNVNDKDEILISWYSQNGVTVYKLTKDLIVRYKKKIMTPLASMSYKPISSFIDKEFNIFVSWKDYNLSTSEQSKYLYGIFYDSAGIITSPKTVIDSAIYIPYNSSLKCISDYKNFIVAIDGGYSIEVITKFSDWEKSKRKSFYATKIGTKMDFNLINFSARKFMMTYFFSNYIKAYISNDNKRNYLDFTPYTYPTPNVVSSILQTSSADFYNGKFVVAYQDSKANTGYDIYANVRAIENFDFGKEVYFPEETGDHLYNNFPNPFNAKTKIAYQLLTAGKVKLTVYDILGREVRVLVDATRQAGIYEVDFDSGSLPSGVYFYRLEAFSVSVKKMLIIK